MSRRVLITGAASGLGRALAHQYAHAGWSLLLVDRDSEQLQNCRNELPESASNPHRSLCLDLTDHEAVSQQITAELQELGGLDLLINNAGITHRSPASTTELSVFDRVMRVNWLAQVHLARVCLPWLQQAESAGIVCISSMAAWMPVPGRAAYCASKAALKLHFETWRPELRQRGIHLLMVYPSFLTTAIEANALGPDGRPTPRPRSVVGRIQSAEHVAERIMSACQRKRSRLYGSQWSSRVGAWLWFHLPSWFQQMTWKKFAEEIPPPDPSRS